MRRIRLYYINIKDGILNKFIDQAKKGKWIAHYHNALYAALYRNSDKKEAVFDKIIDTLEEKGNKGKCTSDYITSAFAPDIDSNYKGQLCTYFRGLRSTEKKEKQT